MFEFLSASCMNYRIKVLLISFSETVLAAGVSLAIFALGGDALTRNNGQPVVLVNTSNFSLFSNG